jgi:amino acid transporter
MGQAFRETARLLLGRPIPTSKAGEERLTRPRGLGAFGLDALSSVAYGPDEILYVLLLAGAAGLALDLPVAIAIALLLLIVTTSYRQTIFAYPRGGGSYTVAHENLGTTAGLTAAAALMVDYVTTVAVSVTAGMQAVIAFAPSVYQYRVGLAVAVIALLVVINLRGVREAGAAFVLPTYIFIGSLGLAPGLGGAAIHRFRQPAARGRCSARRRRNLSSAGPACFRRWLHGDDRRGSAGQRRARL